ncbi:MAG TPA: hypothetical protein VFU47_14150 [Armatimonadota bacterium]|nr:hypothetical protein [Armatimonadota bacterium]
MGQEETMVAMFAIACWTGIMAMILATIRAAFVRRSSRAQDELAAEIRSLRAEVSQLRQQNNDVILSLDTALHRVDQRLSHVETRAPLGASVPAEEARLAR